MGAAGALLIGGGLGAGTAAPLAPVAPPARAMLAACAAALVIAVVLAPARGGRVDLLAAGMAALGVLAALAAAPDPTAAAVLLLLLAALHAARPGLRPFAVRMRGPAFGAMLLGFGWFLARAAGPVWMGRTGAVLLVLGLTAIAGLVPYLGEFEAGEPTASSTLVWTAFLAPVLVLAIPGRLLPLLTASEGEVFGAALIAMGLLNLGWGTLAAWRAADTGLAWRYSFLADWGLALVGIGLLLPDGRRAGFLVLLSIVLVRLPLYLWSRPVLLGRVPARSGPVNLLLGVMLAGAAPFAGLYPRLLLLRVATGLYWPLALVLLGGMLLWVAHALRLGLSAGRPAGRTAVGVALAALLSLALGLVPGVFLAVAGL